MPSAAVHKPQSKWTVVAAFILAVMLHAGAIVWVEMQQATLEADAPVLVHSMEEVLETALAPVRPALPEQEPRLIDTSDADERFAVLVSSDEDPG